MDFCRKTILLLIFSSFMSVGWGCIDGVEVELWGECYNIEETYGLNLNSNQLTGEIPPEICNLTNLTWSTVYVNYSYSSIYNNQLCQPYPDYPECLINQEPFIDENNNGIWDEGEPFEDTNENGIYEEDYVGYQDTSECEEPSLCNEGYTEIDGECYYQSDLDVLQQFIDNSQEGDNPPPSDLSPSELGYQEWENGRLVIFRNSQFHPFVLSGEFPENIGNLVNLTNLDLNYNQLSGEIPESIYNLINLDELLLGNNQLEGEISENICILINIENLVYGENQLEGIIPHCIGNLTNLRNLHLSSNQLTGVVPESLGNLVNLGFGPWEGGLDLNNNQLSGEIPESLGNLVNLKELNLSSNQLSGEIPESIGTLTNLIVLNLSSNQFSGEIPENICNLNVFWWIPVSFDISNNQFCSEYPECIEDYLGEQDCEDCILGDINNDSSLNILDLVSISNLILDNSYDECGDTNSDGELNILDLVILVNIILDN